MKERSIVSSLIYFHLSVLFCCSATFAYGCFSNSPSGNAATATDSVAPIPYDLSSPSQKYALADPELQEISGLSPTDTEGQFCAIADERGEIFILDVNKNGDIVKNILFKEKGDFEGIEMANGAIYAIQSNGKLFEISQWNTGNPPQINNYAILPDEEHDIEGLGYDARRNALLIACKEDPEQNIPRNIWAFDLATKKLLDKPVYTIRPDDIDKKVPLNDGDKDRKFSPSGIAIHPQTGDVYIISTSLKRLAVLDYTSGAVKTALRIDKDVLPQPEGISFDKAGNLYISSEKKKDAAALLKFDLLKH